jgi:hypothetical protein
LASSFVDLADPKQCCSGRVNAPLADGKLTTRHLQPPLVETLPEFLRRSQISMADGGHISPESVHQHLLPARISSGLVFALAIDAGPRSFSGISPLL